jgi:hypothetical protein
MASGSDENEAVAAAPGPSAPRVSFELLLAFSDSVFSVLSLADARVLYVSPSVTRVLNAMPAQLLGFVWARCVKLRAHRCVVDVARVAGATCW